MSESGQGLRDQIDAAQWQWLRAHNERGALVLVDSMLDLAEVGERIAADDLTMVQTWLANSLLVKPNQQQLDDWDQTPTRPFMMLVVSPYVLIQDIDPEK